MYLKMEVLAFSFELLYRAEVKTFRGRIWTPLILQAYFTSGY
jgi:hypothetical protein